MRLSSARRHGKQHVVSEINKLAEGSKTEQELLTKKKEKLEREQLKLLQAHYADAIPLDLLKEEQARIGKAIRNITNTIEACQTEYSQAASNVSIKTLKRAKAELGVVSTKRGDGWYWQLPNYGENKEGQNQGVQPCDDKTAFLTPLENEEENPNLEEEISI